ncbi:MAG: hypothetical protein IT578_04205 [Verrucomicrobiae bacterium]|nr:hypothetical protein [Verrucomicrobiae bacterium]
MISSKPLPFAEAIAALQAKAPVPANVLAEMGDLFEQARLVSFYARYQNNEDQLRDALQVLADGMARGRSYVDMREDLQKVFGGSMGSVQAELIATQNVRLAYGAGRRIQQEQVKEDFPFVRYVHGARFEPEVPRPEHEALHGRIFKLEDAWDLPNGFNCSCDWEPVAREEVAPGDEVLSAEQLFTTGYSELTGAAAHPFMPPESGIERDRDGRFVRVNNSAISLFGWRDAVSRSEIEARKITNLLPRIPAATDPLPAPRPAPAPIRAEGRHPEQLARDIAAANRLDPDKPNAITNPLGVAETIGPNLLRHLAEKGAGEARFRVVGGLRGLVEDPAEIWLLPYRNPTTGRVFLERVYLDTFETAGKDRPLIFAARFDRGRWLDYTAFTSNEAYAQRYRSGARLYARGESP